MNETTSSHSTPSVWFNGSDQPHKHQSELNGATVTPTDPMTSPHFDTLMTNGGHEDSIHAIFNQHGHDNGHDNGNGHDIDQVHHAQGQDHHGQDHAEDHKSSLHLTNEDLKQWANFTNIGDLDFLLDDHLSMFNNNTSSANHNNGPANHHYTDFSHTLFPPIEHAEPTTEETLHMDSNLVRPDLIFTPLVSPLVTPMDKNLQQKLLLLLNQKQHYHFEKATSSNGMFSPLTSPLLEFQPGKSSPIMRIKKETHHDDLQQQLQHRRRTSTTSSNGKASGTGSTPIVGPSIPGRVTKLSPVIKNKRMVSKLYGDIKLPESSMDFKTPSSVPKRGGGTKRLSQPSLQPTQDQVSHLFTPATLMNFKLDKQPDDFEDLGSSVSQSVAPSMPPQSSSSQVVLNPNREHSNSSSPVILPSSTTPLMGPRRSSSVSSVSKINKTNNSSSSINTTTALEDTVLQLASEMSLAPSSDKKVNHKLLEQGRRNRMNNAILNLDQLIPYDWKKDIPVPSKLTTIEVAIDYIKYLQSKTVATGGTGHDTSDSISPFD